MRESLRSINRADVVIINRKFTEKKEIPGKRAKYFEGKKVFTGYYKAISFYDLKSKKELSLEEFEGQKSLVVSGIASPFSFLNILMKAKVDTQNKLIFKDHKKYTSHYFYHNHYLEILFTICIMLSAVFIALLLIS